MAVARGRKKATRAGAKRRSLKSLAAFQVPFGPMLVLEQPSATEKGDK